MQQPMTAREEGSPRSVALEKTQKQLDQFAWMMDNCFRIPGIGWRFGLEAIVGLFPGAGDVLTGVMSLLLLGRALQFRLPKVIVARMILNTLLDVTVGAIPLVGDAFDFIWKSNTRNMQLFREYATQPRLSTRKHWIFIAALIGGLILILFLMVLFITWLVLRFFNPQAWWAA